jgi:hypothetical protein
LFVRHFNLSVTDLHTITVQNGAIGLQMVTIHRTGLLSGAIDRARRQTHNGRWSKRSVLSSGYSALVHIPSAGPRNAGLRSGAIDERRIAAQMATWFEALGGEVEREDVRPGRPKPAPDKETTFRGWNDCMGGTPDGPTASTRGWVGSDIHGPPNSFSGERGLSFSWSSQLCRQSPPASLRR